MDRSKLKGLSKIAIGMSGTVYSTTTRLKSQQGDLVFKEYASAPEINQWIADARHAIAWRNALSVADRRALDVFAAWPVEMVTDGRKPVGCLIPRILPRFFIDERQPNGRVKVVPRTLEKLVGTPRQHAVLGMDVEAAKWTPELRLALAAHLIFAISFLHARGVVYGDISLKNAVFDSANPAVMLLDCDGVALTSNPGRHQPNSPSFLAPECGKPGTNPYSRGNSGLQDEATDVFKLGLILVKTLIPGGRASQRVSSSDIQASVSPTVFQGLTRALSQDPTVRGDAMQLYDDIFDEVSRLVVPPQIASLQPALTTLPRGTDVELTWQAAGATKLRIEGPNGFAEDVPAKCTRWTITPPISGPYVLVATNRFGSSQAECDLQIFDMPLINLDLRGLTAALMPTNLPKLATPHLEAPSLAPFTTALATSMPEGPAVPIPDLEGLLELRALTDVAADLAAIPSLSVPELQHHLDDISELGLDQLVAELGAQLASLAGAINKVQGRVEQVAATAGDAAARRVVDQMATRSTSTPPASGEQIPSTEP